MTIRTGEDTEVGREDMSTKSREIFLDLESEEVDIGSEPTS